MRSIFLVGLIWLVGGAAAGPPKLGEPFTLKVGETATLDDRDVSVTFVGVPRDSRCPRDVHCIVAGEAIVHIDVMVEGAKARLELEIPPGGTDEAFHGGLRFAITELGPEPESGKRMEQRHYVATLVVEERAPEAL